MKFRIWLSVSYHALYTFQAASGFLVKALITRMLNQVEVTFFLPTGTGARAITSRTFILGLMAWTIPGAAGK